MLHKLLLLHGSTAILIHHGEQILSIFKSSSQSQVFHSMHELVYIQPAIAIIVVLTESLAGRILRTHTSKFVSSRLLLGVVDVILAMRQEFRHTDEAAAIRIHHHEQVFCVFKGIPQPHGDHSLVELVHVQLAAAVLVEHLERRHGHVRARREGVAVLVQPQVLDHAPHRRVLGQPRRVRRQGPGDVLNLRERDVHVGVDQGPAGHVPPGVRPLLPVRGLGRPRPLLAARGSGRGGRPPGLLDAGEAADRGPLLRCELWGRVLCVSVRLGAAGRQPAGLVWGRGRLVRRGARRPPRLRRGQASRGRGGRGRRRSGLQNDDRTLLFVVGATVAPAPLGVGGFERLALHHRLRLSGRWFAPRATRAGLHGAWAVECLPRHLVC
mmetsp:Transcript_71661/g.120091  ORF Transcript_71661/g.120091 Transcript_71661/m.120091 type:complete len:381 (-) Transcript_71661:534-1676(-)